MFCRFGRRLERSKSCRLQLLSTHITAIAVFFLHCMIKYYAMKTQVNPIPEVQNEHLLKLRAIVEKTMEEEKLIVNNLLHEPQETITRGQSVSDKVARFGGSWNFIFLFAAILFIWIVFNSIVSKQYEFDPFPFILMNLILSCIAAMQAPVIMMSQNRKQEKDRKRNENDYLINLKAELELRSLHQKVDVLVQEQIKVLFDLQAQQIDALKRIEKSLQHK